MRSRTPPIKRERPNPSASIFQYPKSNAEEPVDRYQYILDRQPKLDGLLGFRIRAIFVEGV